MSADPVISMKLSIFAFLKSKWEFQCYPIFPLFSAKTHSLIIFQAIPHYLSAAAPKIDSLLGAMLKY